MKNIFCIFVLVLCLFIPCDLLAEEDVDTDCGTYSSNAIVAAFNTQGYWALDDMVYQMGGRILEGNKEGHWGQNLAGWAPLIYIFVILGGLIMVAMGMPPKNYMWWVLGPVLFNFLLYTRYSDDGCYGVQWKIGTRGEEDVGFENAQKQVWQFAEVGLVNQNRGRFGRGSTAEGNNPPPKVDYSYNERPSTTAKNLPWFFVNFDYLISDQIGFLVDWAGIGNQEEKDGDGIQVKKPDGNVDVSKYIWPLMSNLKWPMLEDISGAQIHNADIQEGLVRFLASECGTVIADNVNRAQFISASSSRGSKFPEYVLGDGLKLEDKLELIQGLEKRWVPYPEEIRRLLRDEEFKKFSPVQDFAEVNENARWINCMQYIYIVVQGFRWESGFVFNNAVSRAGIPARYVVYSFLYGWSFGDTTKKLEPEEQRKFIQNMILVHLFRNELFKTYFPVDRQFSASERTENYVKANAGQVGSKNKYGELYMWAKLVPYIQGVTLYFLCGAYPFACILMIIPGWHKAFITWMLFYAWAKSWDAGFAVVMGLERNIWGMLGSSGDAATINNRVKEMEEWGKITVTGDGCKESDEGSLVGCTKVIVENGTKEIKNEEGGDETVATGVSSLDVLNIFDRSVTMQYRLDLDVMNAYYVYLMSALFFAVPVVTGQLILAAKAGMANTLTQGISGSAGEAGRAAGQGYLGEISARAANARAVMAQEAFAKELRDQGSDGKKESWASKIITSQNESKKQSMIASQFEAKHHQISAFGQQAGTLLGTNKAITAHLIGGGVDIAGFLKGGAGIFGAGGGGVAGRLKGWLGAGTSTAGGFQKYLNIGYDSQKARVGMATTLAAARMNMYGDIAGGESFYNSAMNERYTSLAGQQVGESQWLARRNMNNQIAGRMCAMGAFHGGFNSGDKPTDIMGMIGSGMAQSFKSNFGSSVRKYNGEDRPFQVTANVTPTQEGLNKLGVREWRADKEGSMYNYEEQDTDGKGAGMKWQLYGESQETKGLEYIAKTWFGDNQGYYDNYDHSRVGWLQSVLFTGQQVYSYGAPSVDKNGISYTANPDVGKVDADKLNQEANDILKNGGSGS